MLLLLLLLQLLLLLVLLVLLIATVAACAFAYVAANALRQDLDALLGAVLRRLRVLAGDQVAAYDDAAVPRVGVLEGRTLRLEFRFHELGVAWRNGTTYERWMDIVRGLC